MKRHIPGLHGKSHGSEDILEGVFLVRGNFAGSFGTSAMTLISWVETRLTKRRSSAFAGSCGFLAPH
jgi:hypothetical protein